MKERKETRLIVDLSQKIGTALHVASGSLYGVTEEKPADEMISQIRPSVLRCSPEAGHQQPRGAAIPVAKRVAAIGARIQICLAEWLTSWPYSFPGMEDWLVMVERTVNEVQKSGIMNIDGYEIFNEPDGTLGGRYMTPIDDAGNAYIIFRVQSPKDNVFGITVRYANGCVEDAVLSLVVNGEVIQNISFPSTRRWFKSGGYGDISINARLKEGYNEIKFIRVENNVELDYIDIDRLEPRRYEAERTINGYHTGGESGYASSDKTDHLTFNELYYITRKKILELEPEARIIGPSFAIYVHEGMRNFLKYQRERDALPDIVCWHHLADQDFTAIYEDYRQLERELKINPIPITINEYSGGRWFDEEGTPGACAPLIAKFERLCVDSALLSYWNNQGTLGSLVTVEGKPNGAFWFYKWYADMTGEMVHTTPENTHDSRLLDGFACVDENNRYVSLLLGGENQGTIGIAFNNFPSFFGKKVKVKIECARFETRSVEIEAADVMSVEEYQINDGSIEVLLDGTNNRDGYRLYLIPA